MGAGQQLGVNTTTVLRRVASLEDDLGARLFERERTGYLVENHTSYNLCLWQHGLRVPPGQRLRTLLVEPHRAEPFVWEQPLRQHVATVEIVSDTNKMQVNASFDNFVESEAP